jgi:hypothetical protein
MAKLKREAHGLYLKFADLDQWFLIGSGIEDLSVEMNGSFEQTKDITGNVSVSDTGYTPQVSVEPYYANPSDAIYEKLKDLALNRKSGDDAKAQILEVIVDDPEASTHDGWVEDCRVEITSYGGDTAGMQINFNVWYDGNRQQKSVTMTGKVPSFS